jgi:hypothetical protein
VSRKLAGFRFGFGILLGYDLRSPKLRSCNSWSTTFVVNSNCGRFFTCRRNSSFHHGDRARVVMGERCSAAGWHVGCFHSSQGLDVERSKIKPYELEIKFERIWRVHLNPTGAAAVLVMLIARARAMKRKAEVGNNMVGGTQIRFLRDVG